MTILGKLRNLLTGRTRKWGNTNNRALQVFADRLEQEFAAEVEFRELVTKALVSSHMTVEGLMFQKAPKADFQVPFSALTVERMHLVHARGMILFAMMFIELNKIPINTGTLDMLRHVCWPSAFDEEWLVEVSRAAAAPKFDLMPLARGFERQLRGIFPEAGPSPLLGVMASMRIGGVYDMLMSKCFQG